MKVVHVTGHKPFDTRIFLKQCRTLAAAGHEVHLLVPGAPDEQVDGVHLHPLPKPEGGGRAGRAWVRLGNAYKAAAALNADVYHFHEPVQIPVAVALKLRGAKVVYDAHEDAPVEVFSLLKRNPRRARVYSTAWSALLGVARRTLDAFVCATPTIAKTFPEGKTITVQNYPLADELSRVTRNIAPSSTQATPQIVYVGGITEIRGIREMIRAMELLPDGFDAEFVLIGEFASRDLQAQVERMPGWQRVRFLGWQSREAVAEALARARAGLVLFHPERDHLDALPNKMFEYMSAGVPVIASNFPLWQEILGTSGSGILVDPLDPAAIARAIQQIIQDPEMAEEMGARGREAVRTRYNWASEAKKLLGLYEELARR